MKSNCPIGVFDSGVGGLSVLKELLKELPNEQFLYFGDTLRVPYGDKNLDELVECTRRILDFFKTKNVKCVIVACNTCSANTIELVKDEYDFEILGLIEPAAKYISSFNVKKIGLIATTATVKSNAYARAIKPFGIEVFSQSCPRLVKIVESGKIDSQEAQIALSEYLKPLLEENIEKLILGCTHYPFLIPTMLECVEKLEVCSPGELCICERLQVPKERIIYSGVSKREVDIKDALEYGADVYTAESIGQVKRLNAEALKREVVVPVILRLSAGSQFGMSKEDLCEVIENRKNYTGIVIEGIHYFAGTQRKKLNEQKKELEMLLAFFAELKETFEFFGKYYLNTIEEVRNCSTNSIKRSSETPACSEGSFPYEIYNRETC